LEPDNDDLGEPDIDNTVTVEFNEAGPQSDSEDVPLLYDPAFTVTKVASDPDTERTAGEVIEYTITVTNTGNVSLTGYTISDPLLDGFGTLSGPSETLTADGILEVDEIWTFTGSYTVTQEDIDSLGTLEPDNDDLGEPDIDNTVTVEFNEAGPQSDSEDVPLLYDPHISLVKTGTFNDEDGDGFADVGETISYQLVATNDGNVTLYNVVLDDALFDLPTGSLSGPTELYGADGVMEVGDAFTWTGTYALTQADLDSNFTAEPGIPLEGGGVENDEFQLENYAVVTAEDTSGDEVSDDDVHEEPLILNFGLIAPTGTDACDYFFDTAISFQDYYDGDPGADLGGQIQYTARAKDNLVISANPGVFFYYTGRSGALSVEDGEDLVVSVNQSVDDPDFPEFDFVPEDVKLWQVADLNGDGEIQCDEVTQVQLFEDPEDNNYNSLIEFDGGDVTVTYFDAVESIGDAEVFYLLSTKYSTDSLAGQDDLEKETGTYSFVTQIDGVDIEGGIIEAAPKDTGGGKGKNKLLLDGEVGDGAEVVSEADLDAAVEAAIAYWEGRNLDQATLNKLAAVNVTIADLEGDVLGQTSGNHVILDDDGAGHGWSTDLDAVDPNMVDLLSAVAHELGHVVGIDHDVMDDDLAVGERDMPMDGYLGAMDVFDFVA
jgi:uncharacterized repeat protein (TIGR01451 family)